MLPTETQIQFFKYLNDEITYGEFESWLYSEKELEGFLGDELYIDLISVNFKNRHAKHEMRKVIDPFLDYGKYEERKLRKLFSDLTNRTDDFAKSLIETYDLYCSGYYFLDDLGLGYGLPLLEEYYDYGNWERLQDTKKKELISRIYEDVNREVQMILEWLESGKIILTGEIDEDYRYHYIDNRSESEKQLRTIERIEISETGKAQASRKGFVEKLKDWLAPKK